MLPRSLVTWAPILNLPSYPSSFLTYILLLYVLCALELNSAHHHWLTQSQWVLVCMCIYIYPRTYGPPTCSRLHAVGTTNCLPNKALVPVRQTPKVTTVGSYVYLASKQGQPPKLQCRIVKCAKGNSGLNNICQVISGKSSQFSNFKGGIRTAACIMRSSS